MVQQCRKLVALTAFFAAIASLGSTAHSQPAPAITPGPDGVVFSIGVEDGNNHEFAGSGWDGVETFTCTVAIDCIAEHFPRRLYAPWATWMSGTAVIRDVVNFNLGTDIANAILRLSRFGIETDVVRIDDGSEIFVAGAGEDRLGHFELPLGKLQAGPHQIVLSLSNEKVGTGRHSLDAIVLMSR